MVCVEVYKTFEKRKENISLEKFPPVIIEYLLAAVVEINVLKKKNAYVVPQISIEHFKPRNGYYLFRH